MQGREKRRCPRYSLKVAVRLHCIEEGSADREVVSETTNISNSGLFLHSAVRLRVGVPVSLTLRVPTHVSGSARTHIQCLAHVVHEQFVSQDKIGYGLQFDRFWGSLQHSAAPARV
jgi:PilZ domain-containing protein